LNPYRNRRKEETLDHRIFRRETAALHAAGSYVHLQAPGNEVLQCGHGLLHLSLHTEKTPSPEAMSLTGHTSADVNVLHYQSPAELARMRELMSGMSGFKNLFNHGKSGNEVSTKVWHRLVGFVGLLGNRG
jgi:hypothetical protein